MSELETRVQAVFRKVFDEDSLEIRPEMTAADVENWDSLNHVHLMIALEREFKVKFQGGEIMKLKNVGQMLELLSVKLKGTH